MTIKNHAGPRSADLRTDVASQAVWDRRGRAISAAVKLGSVKTPGAGRPRKKKSGARPIPAARSVAINLMTRRRDGHGVLKLDKATAWMLQRRLHRNDHAGFQRPLRIIGVVRDRAGI